MKILLLTSLLLAAPAFGAAVPDWDSLEGEILEHFLALIRMDTTDPPGREKRRPPT
jgi:hypothetical protein